MKAYQRLLEYIKYPTASREDSPSCPSTTEQTVFALSLIDEMRSIGISDASIDDNGYVFGTIPPSPGKESAPVIGFIAHMDVVEVVPFRNIKPTIIEYEGGDVVLNEKLGIVLSPADYPEMKDCIGKHIIVTDGTTLLGADDKNGIAEIMTMAEDFISHPELPHGKIRIAFTPDEEIGRGADLFNVEAFGANWAYTLDGGAFGEVEFETFNASSAVVTVNGKSIHPGSAKDKMINASTVAMEFNSLLPALERPEHTENYEGFYMLSSMKGECEKAMLAYILRDHNLAKLEDKKNEVLKAAEMLNRKYGPATVAVDITDSYLNMREIIENNWHLIDTAYDCIRELGYEPVTIPVRGGTDGCRLSFMGLPCPNLGTGGYNFHGRMEFTCIEQMDFSVELIKKIAAKYADKQL